MRSRLSHKDWGFVINKESIKDFIGAEILSVSIDNSLLDSTMTENLKKEFGEKINIQVVNFTTNKGILQIIAYNRRIKCFECRLEVYKNEDVIMSAVL